MIPSDGQAKIPIEPAIGPHMGAAGCQRPVRKAGSLKSSRLVLTPSTRRSPTSHRRAHATVHRGSPTSHRSLLPVVTPARRRATGNARFDGGRFRRTAIRVAGVAMRFCAFPGWVATARRTNGRVARRSRIRSAVEQLVARRAHNPEVAGSSPARAIRSKAKRPRGGDHAPAAKARTLTSSSPARANLSPGPGVASQGFKTTDAKRRATYRARRTKRTTESCPPVRPWRVGRAGRWPIRRRLVL